MKTKLFLFIAICVSVAVSSQTIVPAGPVSGTWAQAESPYHIEGEIFILDGTTLSIEPGVVVEWQGSYPFFVYGQILAQGTTTDSIIFNAKYPFDGFQGIRFMETPLENDSSRFEYCTFKHGRVYKPSPQNSGGALAALDFGKFIVDHCLFTENTAIVVNGDNPGGGAIALGNSSPIITNSLFVDNLAMSAGAILCHDGSNPLIENNMFVDNTADGEGEFAQGYGGAIGCYVDCDPMIRNNTFSNNYAEVGGGAIACVSRCDVQLIQNLFYNNNAFWGGAIELQDTCSAQIINNTIAKNTADFGGGIHIWDGGNPQIINTIIWGNHASDESAGQIYAEVSVSPPTLDFYFTDLQGGEDGIGGNWIPGEYEDCMEDPPEFVGIGDHPYQINDYSLCIDAGDPDYEDYDLPEFDLAGEVRIFNDEVDMGAYEWNTFVGIEESGTEVLLPVLQCYPNPFSCATSIEFELAQPGVIQLSIYNQTGTLVEAFKMNRQRGKQSITWDASDLPSGVYFIMLQSDNNSATKKIMKL